MNSQPRKDRITDHQLLANYKTIVKIYFILKGNKSWKIKQWQPYQVSEGYTTFKTTMQLHVIRF